MIIVFVVLAVAAAYFILGTPLMQYIHQFIDQFVHSFPVLVFFLPNPSRRTDPSARRPK